MPSNPDPAVELARELGLRCTALDCQNGRIVWRHESPDSFREDKVEDEDRGECSVCNGSGCDPAKLAAIRAFAEAQRREGAKEASDLHWSLAACSTFETARKVIREIKVATGELKGPDDER